MADDLDRASDIEEMERAHRINEAASKANSQEVPRTGFCIEQDCDERTHGVFCSADCRTRYNRREMMKR